MQNVPTKNGTKSTLKNKKSVDKEIKLMYNKNRSARAKQKVH